MTKQTTDECGHDFVDFAMLRELFPSAPGQVIGTVKLCRKCYARPPEPKPEPEIEVTEGMRQAGVNAYLGRFGEPLGSVAASIYRAMFKAQEGAAYAAKGSSHHRHTDTLGAPQGEPWSFHQHRRHSDPI